jgi:hypothetical protein
MSTYRAVQAVSPGRLELTQKTLQASGPGKVRIRIEACGSNAATATFKGRRPGGFSIVLGVGSKPIKVSDLDLTFGDRELAGGGGKPHAYQDNGSQSP